MEGEHFGDVDEPTSRAQDLHGFGPGIGGNLGWGWVGVDYVLLCMTEKGAIEPPDVWDACDHSAGRSRCRVISISVRSSALVATFSCVVVMSASSGESSGMIPA